MATSGASKFLSAAQLTAWTQARSHTTGDRSMALSQGSLTLSMLLCLTSLLALVSGCGVTVGVQHSQSGSSGVQASNTPASITITTSQSSVAAGQSLTFALSLAGVPASSISVTPECSGADCGTVSGFSYTAPVQPPAAGSVTLLASSSLTGVTPGQARVQVTTPPAPTISSISPSSINAGAVEQLTIHGSHFTAQSQVLLTAEQGVIVSSVGAPTYDNDSQIEVAVTTTATSTGTFQVVVGATNLSSHPAQVTVQPAVTAATSTLQTYNVANYGASGSGETFSCSGQAGQSFIRCDSDTTDFVPGEGIRIQSAGPPSLVPAVTAAPVITPSSNTYSGSHTYCYVVTAVDPLQGVSVPSPPSCIGDEPLLSVQGISNSLTAGIQASGIPGPTPAYLWYVSTDGNPYQLLNIQPWYDNAGDWGQRIGTMNSWPDNLPVGEPSLSKNEDLFTTVTAVSGGQLTLATPLISAVSNTLVAHDDTGSIQAAINAADSAGGGIVQFDKGTYNIWRPSFLSPTVGYPTHSTNPLNEYWWSSSSYLYIENGSHGNISIQGDATATVLVTPPAHSNAIVLDVGNFGRPAYAPYTSTPINSVAKGDMSLTLVNPADASTYHAGDDIWIYGGAFGQPNCSATDGTAGGQCHYSELNTITSVQGSSLSLAYPASKRYYDDGSDSFGIVKLPVTPHNVTIQNLTIDTGDPITSMGMVYGLLVNNVTVVGDVTPGPFGGGFKRDVLIENSRWMFGDCSLSYQVEDEYDQFTDLAFVNDQITGCAAPGSEGPSMQARIFGTEGTSELYVSGSTFVNASLYAGQTTDDVITGNTFTDGIIAIGYAYSPYNNGYVNYSLNDASFLSFDSQTSLQINNNVFIEDPAFAPPWVIKEGHFTSASINDNTIDYAGSGDISLIISNGGTIENNEITTSDAPSARAIVVDPDEAPGIDPAPFTVSGNTITGGPIQAGIYLTEPGFSDSAPICITNNSWLVSNGQEFMQQGSGDVQLSCLAQ